MYILIFKIWIEPGIKSILQNIIKHLIIHQITHQCVALKSNITIYITICTQSTPTCKGITVTPSSGRTLICV